MFFLQYFKIIKWLYPLVPFKIRPFLVFVRAQWCWQNPSGFALMNHSWKSGKLKFWSCPANPQLLAGFLVGSLGLFLFNILVPSTRSSESRWFGESISSQIQCISKIVEVWCVAQCYVYCSENKRASFWLVEILNPPEGCDIMACT